MIIPLEGFQSYAESCKDRIKVLQKKAVRIIDRANYNANTAPIFKKLKILRIDDIIDLELAKLSYRFVKKDLPSPISSLFTENAFNHNYNTRFKNNPRAPRHRTSILNKSFLNRSQTVWSKLDTSIRNSTKCTTLKSQFVKLKLNLY